MQNRTWIFSIATSTVLVMFYFLAEYIGTQAPGFVFLASVILAANAYMQFKPSWFSSSKVVGGEG